MMDVIVDIFFHEVRVVPIIIINYLHSVYVFSILCYLGTLFITKK